MTSASPSSGTSAPGGYLVIITAGLAPTVNLSSLALLTDAGIGDKITLAANGQMMLASSGADGLVVGKMAATIDKANGTIALFIDID